MASTLCGDGDYVTRSQLRKVKTPQATDTWVPLPHDFVVQQVEQTIAGTGDLEIAKETYLLSRFGQRMFGVIDLKSKKDDDYGLSVGIRNSHDKSFPVTTLLGGRVFICSNLSFFSERAISTKHTKFVMERMPKLLCSEASKLLEGRGHMDRRIATYKEREIEPKKEAAYLMLQFIKNEVVPTRQISDLMDQWESPAHEEFGASWNAWRMFNAVTEVLKQSSQLLLPVRTQRLHGLLDAHCGVLATSV